MMLDNRKNRVSFFQETVLKWFEKNGRKYPWRAEKNTYKKLIAEIMLQRTRVEQVLPVYEKFVKKYPDLKSVSEAAENDISKFISKLGLFWRSRAIKKMAEFIISEYSGRIPAEKAKLLEIPGIGNYIADAMIVFAFNGKRTVIDGNVVRLATRFFGMEKKPEIRRNREFITFCQSLSEDLETAEVEGFNYSLIDFSAAICKQKPLCVSCPLSKMCSYFLERK